jgi:cellobiose-specific phosphotransferase system component IIA
MEEINNNLKPQNEEKELVPVENNSGELSIISDEMLLGIYGEILDNIRQDRVQIDSYVNEFAEMVINTGDASSASKEALVNLVRAKMDASDKMSKVADLMTRLKMKDTNTFKPYMNKGNNTINIIENSSGKSKSAIMKELKKKKQQQQQPKEQNNEN